jgi:sugar phosphate permease
MIGIGLSVFGIGITTPYYIPSGIYSTKYGGAKYCGTVAAVFDGFGYLASFVADNLIGYLSDDFGWSVVLFMMVLQAVGAMTSQFFYQISIHPTLFRHFDCYKPKLKQLS